MLNISNVLDVVRRRTQILIKEDDIGEIVVVFNKNFTEASVRYYLTTNPPKDELTKLAFKYMNMFEDLADTYSISMYPASDKYRPAKSVTIYELPSGFINLDGGN